MTRSTFYLRQYMTKALSITLILGLLLSSLALSSGLSESLNTIAQALTTSGDWTDDGNYSTAWYDDYKNVEGIGTENNPYLISTAADLAGLAYLVNNGTDDFENKVIKLTADIDLAAHYWVPIGDIDCTFRGTFDGLYGEEETHTIKNMLIGTEDNPAEYEYAGLFGYVKDTTIENVNIDESCKIYNDRYYIGGICGYACNTMINNCTNSGTVCSNGNDKSTHIGGICGYACSSMNEKTIISNCTNKGTVSSESNNSNDYTRSCIGGICGYADDETNISNCINTGNISSSEERESHIGGICGEINGQIISNCINTGNISSSEVGMSFIGGIFGRGYPGYSSDKLEVNKCTNNGNISSNDNTASYVGGICGDASDSTMSNCTNSGTISSESNAPDVGGICGNASDSTMSNCTNSGTISSNASEEGEVGGICGDASDSTMSNCTNSGTISSNASGKAEVGGICGDASKKTTMSNCSNSGNVSHISNPTETTRNMRVYIGGICGDAYNQITISNCTNSGNVSHISNLTETTRNMRVYIGGICGWTYETTISNCYYQEGTAEKGIGNKDADDQEGTTALPESQMIAAAGADAEDDWVEIDEIGTVALVDALNNWVATNNTENDLLNWVQNADENNGYPSLNN